MKAEFSLVVGMNTRTNGNRLTQAIKGVMRRYEQYTKYLDYPREWGERAFRGWLVFEVFHTCLKWPIKNIVFGETYDVLFVNDDIQPMIYVETKKPGRGLADYEDFRGRIHGYQTIQYAVLANGYLWLKKSIVEDSEEKIRLEASPKKWKEFVRPLKAKNYLYGAWR